MRDGLVGAIGCMVLIPHNALIAGFFNRNREGRWCSRPPLWLAFAFTAELALVTFVAIHETGLHRPPAEGLLVAAFTTVVVPLPAFLAARALAIWIQPRLHLYARLGDYLRVMWVPIGGFAIGYLAIIVVFAGFFGMLERFAPGSFTGGAGIVDWISFSFYSAIAEPHSGITPVSGAARLLLGAQIVLCVGWALVVFAAVMSAIQPQLDAIARRRGEGGG